MKKLLIFGLVLFFAAGCFEMQQEYWVNPDGSGRMKVVFGLSQELVGMMSEGGENPFDEMKGEEAKIKEHPNVKGAKFVEFDEGEMHYVGWDVEVYDVTQLGEVYNTAFSDKEEGGGPSVNESIEVIKTDNGSFMFKFTLHQDASKEPVSEDDKMAAEMAKSMFEGKFYTVKIHGNIVETNGELNEDGNAAQWQIPMADMMSDDYYHKELQAEVR